LTINAQHKYSTGVPDSSVLVHSRVEKLTESTYDTIGCDECAT